MLERGKDLPYFSMNTRKFIKKFDVNLIKLFFLIIIISIVLKRDQWCIIKRDVIALLGPAVAGLLVRRPSFCSLESCPNGPRWRVALVVQVSLGKCPV